MSCGEQYYQAMNEWRAVIAQEPGNIEAHLALAHLRSRMAAFREHQFVLLLTPDHREARQAIVRFGGVPAD